MVKLAAQLLQQPHRSGSHDHPTPATRGPVQHRPHQAQARPLPWQPADHLDAPAGLPEGPLDQIGVADPGPVLTRKAQEAGQLGQDVQQAGDRRGVALLVAVGEGVRPAAGLGDRSLAGLGGDVVEDLPERGLDLGLGVGGDLGQQIPGAVD
jgi:hypothetical protein